MDFKEQLKAARQETGLTQKALIKVLEDKDIPIPSRTYESWEMGEKEPPKYVQALLLDKLKSLAAEAKGQNSINKK